MKPIKMKREFVSGGTLIIVLGIFAFNCIGLVKGQTCLDEDGNPVDWYIAYKLPIIADHGELYKSGLAYIYITSENIKHKDSNTWSVPDTSDSETINFLTAFKELFLEYVGYSRRLTRNQKIAISSSREKKIGDNVQASSTSKENDSDYYWTISAKHITDPKSIILRSLAIAYDKKRAGLNSIFYNDAPPGSEDEEGTKSNSVRAHAKGALLFNEVTGDSIWLSHSTPQFPPVRDAELKFGDNFIRNGQTFMCINFDLNETGKQIIDHLVNMNPLVYDDQLSDKMFETIPELSNLKLTNERKRVIKNDVSTLAQTIKTRAGMELQLYSKSAAFDGDMYSSWINNELETALYVESWRNGKGNPLESSCPRDSYSVNNVRTMKLGVQDARISWSSSIDHSKWAISNEKSSGYVCIADINRMQSQFKRGGGAICIHSPSCWSLFSGLISDIEPCPVGIKPPSSSRAPAKVSKLSSTSLLSEKFTTEDGFEIDTPIGEASPLRKFKYISIQNGMQKDRLPVLKKKNPFLEYDESKLDELKGIKFY